MELADAAPTVVRAISVVIVDDHPLLLEGTRALVARSAGIVVAGVANSGEAALRMVGLLQPDVLLLDLHLPGISGIEVARRIRARFPRVAILALTGYDDLGYARELSAIGARGYLRKCAPGAEVLAAIRAVAMGQSCFAAAGARLRGAAADDTLTARESEILRLLACGRRNAEIAVLLSVSIKTVEYHISHILNKLGARSRTEAILKARQHGFALPEAPLTFDR